MQILQYEKFALTKKFFFAKLFLLKLAAIFLTADFKHSGEPVSG